MCSDNCRECSGTDALIRRDVIRDTALSVLEDSGEMSYTILLAIVQSMTKYEAWECEFEIDVLKSGGLIKTDTGLLSVRS